MLKHVVKVGGAVTAALLGFAATASADGWGSVDCTQAPAPLCQVQAGSAGTSRPASSASSPGTGARPSGQSSGHGAGQGASDNLSSCTYRPSGFQGHPGVSGWRPPGSWYEGTCSLTGVIRNPTVVPALTPEDVARLARAQLGLPQPRVAASPAGDQLVNLPTWLWLEDGWEVVAATASVPGVVVTATARPRSVSWSTGDGRTVTCAGPGTRYEDRDDPRSPSPDCGHTYRRSSEGAPGERYRVAATVHWSVTWSGAGESGTFPEMTTTAATRLRVGESQALNVDPGPR